MIWQGKHLQAALKVEVRADLVGERLQFNSRDIQQNDIFIALPGATDGNFFAQDAIDRGASCVIIDKILSANLPKEKTILVPSTTEALRLMAEYKRKCSRAKFIGVTGSVGKTSTKEALKIMFAAFGKVFGSRGNFNNEIGVPLNLASMPEDLDYAIFELGMTAAGEIKKLSFMVKPDVALITSIAPAHLEFFNSIENIVSAKCEIFEGLDKAGVAIINKDSMHYDQMIKSIDRADIRNVQSFGHNEVSSSRLLQFDVTSNFTKIVYNICGAEIKLSMPYILPLHMAENFAGCLQVAASSGLDLTKAAESLSGFTLEEGRGKIINVSKGEKKFKIISDYYNANPASLKASLQYFKQIKHLKKVVILGDMLELGKYSYQMHEELVPFIVDSGATKILLVGEKMNFIGDLLPKKLYKAQFENVELLVSELSNILQDDEIILVKGSRGIRLQRVIEFFDQD